MGSAGAGRPCKSCDCAQLRLAPSGACECGHSVVAHISGSRAAQHDEERGDVSASAGSLKRCPECAESVMAAAKVCKHCRHRFDAPLSTSIKAPIASTVTGFIFALLWIGGVGSIVAIVLGHRARRSWARSDHAGRGGLAIAALVLGYLGVVVAAVVWFVVVRQWMYEDCRLADQPYWCDFE